MAAPRLLLIDGYNVINRIPELCASLDGGLQNARNQLALRVSGWSREHPGVECVIVFDGDFENSGGRVQRLAGIRCVFSFSRHGGDDELIRLVRDHKGAKSDITVVSDDNKVGNNCRAHGASVRPSDFIMARKARPAMAKAGFSRDGKNLDGKATAAIDTELKKKWG
jgi:predicted RNA-binding protein with PIN domain